MDAASTDIVFFWLIAAAMAAVALWFVLPRLWKPRSGVATASASTNVDVYRRQAAELDRDFAAGALATDEYRAAKNDLEARFLAEISDERGGVRAMRATRRAAVAIGVALPVAAIALYAVFGDPTALTARALDESKVASGATPEAMRARLAAHLERSPRAGRGWVLLARIDFEGERFADAAASYAKALAVSQKVARDPDVWCEYADALGMAQGGSLAGKPREAIAQALAIDASHARALEMAGSSAFEDGDAAAAARYWRQLLAQLPERSPQRRELAIAVARAEQFAAAGRGTEPR